MRNQIGRGVAAMGLMGVLALAACEREGAAKGAGPAKAGAAGGGAGTIGRAEGAVAPAKMVTVSPEVKSFQAQLRDVTATSKRVLWSGGDSYARSDAGASVSMTLALRDGVGSRIYRFCEGSVLRSVVDGNGKELLGAGEGAMRMEIAGGRGSFPTALSAERTQLVPQTIRVSVPRLPETIAKIAGEYRLEVVNQDAEKLVEMPEIEKAVEVTPGVSAVLKMLDVPAEWALTGPPTPGAATPMVRASVEVRSAVATADKTGALVLSVEVVDASGSVVATLISREEATVGGVYRRRFSNVGENPYPTGRSERTAAKAPKALRFRVLTEIEQVTVPFEFGPIDLLGEERR